MPESIPFIPGLYSEESFPLGRFLPPIPFGVVSTWLKENIPAGAWVIDPVCAAPAVTAEAARAGYRVLVAANNPIERFLLELYCQPPSIRELSAALAELSAIQKGTERIEPYIRSLYSTICPGCGTVIEAQSYTWERQTMKPIRRKVACPVCGEEGDFPATPADQERAARHSAKGLHWFRALERVAPINDPDRRHVEDAMAAYLPRSVDALFTLVNRLDHFPFEKRRLIAALLIPVFDLCNTLWAVPLSQHRPKQISHASHFREINVWSALEDAIQIWSKVSQQQGNGQTPIPVSHFPDLVQVGGGITIFDGRLKELSSALQTKYSQASSQPLDFKAALITLPRPNQAYWSLSTLWAGWLWGSESTESFKSVLRRKRYDWGWHCTALVSVFASLVHMLEDAKPCLGLIGESEPGFIASSLLAGASSKLKLNGVAIQQDRHQAQIHWQSDQNKSDRHNLLPSQFQQMVARIGNQAVHQHLIQRGEPVNYALLHAFMLSQIIQSKEFQTPGETNTSDLLSMVQSTLVHTTSQDPSLWHLGGSERFVESGAWYLRLEENEISSPGSQVNPLLDRVEIELVRILQEHPGLGKLEIERSLYRDFPGFYTPDADLVDVCLDSYAEQGLTAETGLHLRKQDQPAMRQADLLELEQALEQTAKLVGFNIYRTQPLETVKRQAILLQRGADPPEFLFFIIASAVLGPIIDQIETQILQNPVDKPLKKILVIPGSRSNLIQYKLEHNPLLKKAIQGQWRFLKFRSLRRLVKSSQLNATNLDQYLSQDPLEKTDPQLSLW